MNNNYINENLKNIIKEIDSKQIQSLEINLSSILNYYNSEFIEIDNFIVMKHYTNVIENVKNELQSCCHFDSIEFSANKIYLSTCLKKSIKNRAKYLIYIGLFVIDIMGKKIKSIYPEKDFMFTLSYNLKGKFKDCLVSFQQKRNDLIITDEYIEDFKTEAVGYYFF